MKSMSMAAALGTLICAATLTVSAGPYKKAALQDSLKPIHPGVPGEVPFWNGFSKRFIYAPTFDFKPVDNAANYRYEVKPGTGGTTLTFESKTPYAALSLVWDKVPVGSFTVTVSGLSKDGKVVGTAGTTKRYRAAPFDGIYHEPPVLPYSESARLALENLLHKDYVNYWLEHQKPDFEYLNNRYPAKIYSALVVGAVTQARLKPEEKDRSTSLAITIADYMLEISVPKGSAWEYFVPTYHGPKITNKLSSHMRPENLLSTMGVDAGTAFLDLYDLTGNEKYLQAAKRIANTYLKTQLDNGAWYLFVNHKTGKPFSESLAIPTAMINYFDRLSTDYKMTGLDDATSRALAWIMNNPVKTFDWHGQFEDVKPHKAYQNQSREQACELAMYLFKNKEKLDLAEELVRFAEDQFVIWERPRDYVLKKGGKDPGWHTTNWITPSVQEQYVFWMPVGRSAGIMVDTYWKAYAATGKDMYLAKAKSIANSFTVVQKANNGDFPTMFIGTPWKNWLNSAVYPAKVLMQLDSNLKAQVN